MRCKPKSSRKQPRRKKEWEKNKLKQLKTTGKMYILRANKNSEYKIRAAKPRKPKYCKWRFSENNKLINEELDLAFSFIRFSDSETEISFITKYQRFPQKQATFENQSISEKVKGKRTHRRHFINDRSRGKNLFMGTFGVSSAQIDTLVKKQRQGGELLNQHGKHANHWKISHNTKADLQSTLVIIHRKKIKVTC